MITKEIIVNCYRKLKTSIYFQKSMSYLKESIVNFEYEDDYFDQVTTLLSEKINNRDYNYFLNLIDKIDFYPFPKKIKDTKSNQNDNITNLMDKTEKIIIEELNYYFYGPVELLIIDVLFTLLLGKHLHNTKIMKDICYANRFDRELYDNDEINFKSLSIFSPYFPLYKHWKNKSIKRSQEIYNEHKDSSIISLDITGYYYHIDADINLIIHNHNPNIILNDDESFLCDIIQKCIDRYSSIIKSYRLDLKNERILPIGLNISCVIANLYLEEFDERVIGKVREYGRYVDDIVFVVEGCENKHFSDFVQKNSDLFREDENGNYVLVGFDDLIVKKDKCRVISNYANGSDDIFKKLYEEERTVSDYNLFPSFDADIDLLINEAYKKQEYIKFRDVQNISIDSSKISKVANGLVTSTKGADCRNSNIRKHGKNLNNAITNNDLLLLFNRWDKLLILFSLTSKRKTNNDLLKRLSVIGGKIKFLPSDSNVYGDGRSRKKENNDLLVRIKKSLKTVYASAYSSFLSLIGTNDEKNEIAVKKYRKANYIDYTLIPYPIINYCCGLKVNENLLECPFELYISLLRNGYDYRKISLSPYYIQPNDYMWAEQIKNIIDGNKNINYEQIYNDYYDNIGPYFGSIKENILFNKSSFGDEMENISIDFSKSNIIQVNTINKSGVLIALAGINLDKMKITKEKSKRIILNRVRPTLSMKKAVINLLNDAYVNSFKTNKRNVRSKGDNIANDGLNDSVVKKKAVNYIVFPESFLPFEWIHLLDKFAKETMSMIVTGIRYVVYGSNVHNVVATIVPFFNRKYHKQSLVFLREKNVMPLYERNILKNSGLSPHNAIPNRYYTIKKDDVTILPLVCYETTDVTVRSCYKNKVDYIFSIEYNKDVGYFQSIGMATSRDLFCFFLECNSSNYGSASFAPMRNQFNPIAADKGDYRDHMFILKTDLESLIEYKDGYNMAYTSFSDYDFTDSSKSLVYDKRKSRFKKPSANTK